MKRFVFKLESLLKFREFKQKEAEVILAGKAAKCARLNLELENNAKAYADAMHNRFKAGLTVVDYKNYELYCMRLIKAKDKLLSDLALAEQEREEARLLWIETNKNKEVTASLKEQEKKAWHKANATEEVYALDDIASGVKRHG